MYTVGRPIVLTRAGVGTGDGKRCVTGRGGELMERVRSERPGQKGAGTQNVQTRVFCRSGGIAMHGSAARVNSAKCREAARVRPSENNAEVLRLHF